MCVGKFNNKNEYLKLDYIRLPKAIFLICSHASEKRERERERESEFSHVKDMTSPERVRGRGKGSVFIEFERETLLSFGIFSTN